MKLTYSNIEKTTKRKGYKFWTGKYNPFLYGIRSRSMVVDEWNDILGICFEDDFGNKINLMHRGSTKPGLYWLKKKMGNVNGTAILIPGQYRRCWTLGKHKDYKALVQARNDVFKVWRDNDQDGQFDYNGKVYEDVTGLNGHTESLLSKTEKVGAYSAGCQVREFDREHFVVMNLLEKSIDQWGDSFSYTLFEDRDFID